MEAVPHPMQSFAEANKPSPDCIPLFPNRIAMGIRAMLKGTPIPLIYTTPMELKRGAERVARSDAAIAVMQGKMSIEEYQKQFSFPIPGGQQ